MSDASDAATQWKQKGNEAIAKGNAKEARKCYTKAINSSDDPEVCGMGSHVADVLQ